MYIIYFSNFRGACYCPNLCIFTFIDRSNELDSDKLHRLPTFVFALGNIINQIEKNDGTSKCFVCHHLSFDLTCLSTSSKIKS